MWIMKVVVHKRNEYSVGAATATGDGDEMMKYCLSFLIVEKIRDGKHPQVSLKTK